MQMDHTLTVARAPLRFGVGKFYCGDVHAHFCRPQLRPPGQKRQRLRFEPRDQRGFGIIRGQKQNIYALTAHSA